MQKVNSTNAKIGLSILSKVGRLKNPFLLFNLIILSNTLVFGQYGNNGDTLQIYCELPNASVMDGKDLRANIIIRNNSDHKILVYSELAEGTFNNMLGDNINNLKLIVQRKTSRKFRNYSNGVFIDPAPEIDTNDILKRTWLFPKDSVVNFFHVDSRFKFVAGYYRMKCLYWNNNHVNKNIKSNWIYFRVLKTIYVNHYWNETSSTDSTKVLQ